MSGAPEARPRFSEVLSSDLCRLTGFVGWSGFWRQLLRGEAFRYNVALRLAQHLASSESLGGQALFLWSRVWLSRLRRSRGIKIPWQTSIGPGLFIGHCGGIVVSPLAQIGRDCNISHNVTIGVTRGGRLPGAPVIGDRVYIGPGAVLIGGIVVGNDVAIGANAVVTKDVPDGATVRGNPAVIHRGGGSGDYVNRTSESAKCRP